MRLKAPGGTDGSKVNEILGFRYADFDSKLKF